MITREDALAAIAEAVRDEIKGMCSAYRIGAIRDPHGAMVEFRRGLKFAAECENSLAEAVREEFPSAK